MRVYIQLETPIHNLVPNCFAEWTVVNETSFEYFDASLIVSFNRKCCGLRKI